MLCCSWSGCSGQSDLKLIHSLLIYFHSVFKQSSVLCFIFFLSSVSLWEKRHVVSHLQCKQGALGSFFWYMKWTQGSLSDSFSCRFCSESNLLYIVLCCLKPKHYLYARKKKYLLKCTQFCHLGVHGSHHVPKLRASRGNLFPVLPEKHRFV